MIQEKHLWLLRWGLDYVKGSTVWGLWSKQGEEYHQAQYQSRDGLRMALIQAENSMTHEQKTIQCTPDEFVEFRWHATAKLGNLFNIQSARTYQGKIFGLSLVTLTHNHTFYEQGNAEVETKLHNRKNLQLFILGETKK